LITRLTPGVLLPPDHRHELKFLIPITLLDMTTITVIDHGMSLSVLYYQYYNIYNTGNTSIVMLPVSCIYNTGIPELFIYTQYQKLQSSSSNNTGNTSIAKHTILEAPVFFIQQYW
jgi:hypothetical protein